uniref:Putative polysaccharide pyruvyl transferase family protein n=1 Tax=viral metagenome TaxID=1070528 RepID=A0A6M3JQN9_9ZZZZ
MRIALLGWYCHGNLGDEAMLEGFKLLLSNHHVTAYNDYSVDLRGINQSDLFILGGGELINTTRLFLPIEHWIRKVSVPRIIFSCGVNAENYDQLEPHVKQDLECFQYIGVRDRAAYDMLKASPLSDRVHLTLDTSLLLQPPKHTSTSGLATIIPTDRKHKEYDAGILATNITQTVASRLAVDLKRHGITEANLLAFGGDDNDDFETCRQIAPHLNIPTKIIKPNNPTEAMQYLAQSEVAYTHRLHGMLLAYLTQTPFLCYGYHRKVKRMFDTLNLLEVEAARQIVQTKIVEATKI